MRPHRSASGAASATASRFSGCSCAISCIKRGSDIPAFSAERYVLKDFRGSSHRLLAAWTRELPTGAQILELGPGPSHVALLVDRSDLHWLGLEGSLDCVWSLRRILSGGAIV